MDVDDACDAPTWAHAQELELQYWKNQYPSYQQEKLTFEATTYYLELFSKWFAFDGKIAVDIGCGPKGLLPHVFARLKIGVDPLMSRYYQSGYQALQQYQTLYLAGMGEAIPLGDECADVAYCVNVLDHTRNPETVLIEIGRILKPGGLFVLYTDLRTAAQVEPLHPIAFSKSWVLEMLGSLGFTPLEIHTLPVGRSMKLPTLWGVFQKEWPHGNEKRSLPDVNRMWWLQCPVQPHNLHRFRIGEHLYVADLEVGHVLEIDPVTWDVIERCFIATQDEMVATLSGKYGEEEIHGAFEALGEAQRDGLLFPMESEQESLLTISHRRKVFAPMAGEILVALAHAPDDIGRVGALAAYADVLHAMAQRVDVVTLSEVSSRLAEGIYGIPLSTSPESLDIPLHLLHHDYDGIYLFALPGEKLDFRSFLPLFDLEVPIVYHLSSPEARDEEGIHNVLLMYAVMREFDAFCVPTESAKAFYCQHLSDSDCFHVVPDGVDVEHFYPMGKGWAKQQLASLLNTPGIAQKPVVGFVGPFQPERGSNVFLKLAALNPDFFFVLCAKKCPWGRPDHLPENLIFAGEPAFKRAPLFMSALDVCCFPVMCDGEPFHLTLLPAMACGIPPIVPRGEDVLAMVGDAGILVESESFESDIGGFKNASDIWKFFSAIQKLISDPEMCKSLSRKARIRALNFKTQKASLSILNVFEKLNEKKRFITHDRPQCDQHFGSVCLTEVRTKEKLAHLLLKRQTPHEVEVVLRHLCFRLSAT